MLNGTLTGQRYINEVLKPVVLPFVQQHHIVLQDDNARPHRARIVQQFLQQNNVDHLDWPLDPLTCPQSSLFGTFSANVYDREFHDQEGSKLWAQPCKRSGYLSYNSQTHQEYASSLCGLHGRNRWIWVILTEL